MKRTKHTETPDRHLLTRYLTGETSEEEKKLADSWLAENKEQNREFSMNRELLRKVDQHYKSRRFNTETAWNKISHRIGRQQKTAVVKETRQIRHVIMPLLKYAAVLVITVITGFLFYYVTLRNKPSELIQIKAAGQVLQEQILPDGTSVALNSHSMLSYPEQFAESVREVSIEGEAFFEVIPDSAKPFVVNAGDARIRVMGTSFNISSFPDKELVEVIVRTGMVRLYWNAGQGVNSPSLDLVQGEKGIFDGLSKQLIRATNTDPNYLAWKTGNLIFRETTLREVIYNLEKIYFVDVEITDPSIDSLTLTAHFDDQPVDYILKVIQMTFNLDLNNSDGKYVYSYKDY